MATGGNVPDPNAPPKPQRTTAPTPTKPAKPAPKSFAPKGKK